jgi:hypothetical protein
MMHFSITLLISELICLISLSRHVLSTPSVPDSFTFLVEGEPIQYTSATKINRVALEVAIPFSRKDSQAILEEYNKLLNIWNTLPAFNEATVDDPLAIKYLTLAAIPVKQILALSLLIDKVYNFKDATATRKPESECKYTHTEVALSDMTTQVANVKTSFGHIGTTWTLESIKIDPTKDLILRTAMLSLSAATDVLTESFNELFSVVDTLSSSKMPEAARGMYHTAPCIGVLMEEKIVVLDCFPSPTGFMCDLEIQAPLKVVDITELYPVYFNGIRLVGHTIYDRFISVTGTHEIKLLRCDHYSFNEEDLPSCHTDDLEDDCERALQKNSIEDVIKHCKFLEETPPSYRQTKTDAFLIQGSDLFISHEVKGAYIPLTVPEPPIIILSPNALKIRKDLEEWILTPSDTTVALLIVSSLLTPDQIDTLSNKYFYQNLFDSFDSEDYMRNSLLILQIILYPFALAGLALGVIARKRLFNMVIKGKGKPTAYASNKMAMQTLLKK